MNYINIKDLVGSDRDVEFQKGGFRSIRPIVESDGFGFAVCKTIIPKSDPQLWHYRNKKEACYCIEGEGELVDIKSGKSWHVKKDGIYMLDEDEPHTFQALTNRVVLISIFNPPIKGHESHKIGETYD